jgi:hypothetical protein
MAPRIEQAKTMLKSMLGIVYDQVEDGQVVPIIPTEDPLIRRQNSGKNSQSLGEIWNEITPHIKGKESIGKRYNRLREINVVESILGKVRNDILTKGRQQGDSLIEIIYDGSADVEDICNSVLKTFQMEKVIEETLYDFLLFGEYILDIDWKGSELDDKFDYNDIMSVYSRGKVVECFKLKSRKTRSSTGTESYQTQMAETIDSNTLLIFQLPGNRIKLEVYDKSDNRYYVKIPTPFISPYALELLNILLLLEKLIPLSQLVRIDKGQMLTAPVPPGTPVNQVFDLVKEYENKLNAKRSTDIDFEMLDINELMRYFGKYKVIPVLGEKGGAEVRDLPQPADLQFENFDYVLRALSSRLNIPTHYIINSDTPEQPREVLNYFNRIKSIRENIAESVKVFLVNYFEYRKTSENSNVKLDIDKLTVRLPSVPGTESLDSVDYIDALSGTLANVYTILDNFKNLINAPEKGLMKQNIVNMMNQKLQPILGADMFEYDESMDPPPPEGEGGEGGGEQGGGDEFDQGSQGPDYGGKGDYPPEGRMPEE